MRFAAAELASPGFHRFCLLAWNMQTLLHAMMHRGASASLANSRWHPVTMPRSSSAASTPDYASLYPLSELHLHALSFHFLSYSQHCSAYHLASSIFASIGRIQFHDRKTNTISPSRKIHRGILQDIVCARQLARDPRIPLPRPTFCEHVNPSLVAFQPQHICERAVLFLRHLARWPPTFAVLNCTCSTIMVLICRVGPDSLIALRSTLKFDLLLRQNPLHMLPGRCWLWLFFASSLP